MKRKGNDARASGCEIRNKECSFKNLNSAASRPFVCGNSLKAKFLCMMVIEHDWMGTYIEKQCDKWVAKNADRSSSSRSIEKNDDVLYYWLTPQAANCWIVSLSYDCFAPLFPFQSDYSYILQLLWPVFRMCNKLIVWPIVSWCSISEEVYI